MSTVKRLSGSLNVLKVALLIATALLILVACGGNGPPQAQQGRVSGTVVVGSTGTGSSAAGSGLALSAEALVDGVSGAEAGVSASSVSRPAFDESNLDFVPGEIVVRFAGGGLAASALPLLEAAGESLRFERALAAQGMRLYRSPGLGKVGTLAAVRELNARADVLYAFPNYIYRAALAPNDSFYDRQWHYDAINLEAAWDVTTGSSDVVVAVIDSGIISDHPDFAGRLLAGYDFITDAESANDGDGRDADPYDDVNTGDGYHGTHVAGTIGAATDNGVGVAGVDWSAKILPLRVLGDGGTFVDVTDAMLWAVGGSVPGVPFTNANAADVINLSLGGQQACSQGWQDVIDNVSQFAVVVAAAGNDTISANGFAPANCSDVIAVGASDFNGERSWYSNFGSAVDVMAPGGDLSATNFDSPRPDGVLSTGDNGAPTYVYMQGTSMAAPHISGLVALMKALDLSVDTNFALAALRASATPLSDAACDGPSGTPRELFSADCGAGLVDAALALEYIDTGVVPPPNNGVLSFTPASLEFGASSENASYTIKNVSGAPIDWSLTHYEYAPDTPGATIPADAVTTNIGSGSLAVNATQSLTLSVDRDALTEDGYYRFWLRFEVSGEPNQLYQVSFVHSVASGPDLSGPMVVAAYQEDQFGDLVATGSQQSSGAFSNFSFEVQSGSTLLGAWSDENDDGLVNSGDFVGYGDSFFNVAAGQHVSGLNLTLQPVFDSPSGRKPEYLRQLEELQQQP